MSNKTDGLAQARAIRSAQKRRAVELAIATLRDNNEVVTFVRLAELAKVSRGYLYNNFKDQISSERDDTRGSKEKIDGVIVPNRTPDEFKSIEAVLKNKLERMKQDNTALRRENARLKNALEKERGSSEHFRQLWINTRHKA